MAGADAPLIFSRKARSRVIGCLAYALLLPLFAAIAALAGAFLGMGISRLFPAREALGGWLTGALSAAGFLAAAVWGIRDYLRRSTDRVAVHLDRLEFGRGSRMLVIPFDQVAWTEGPDLTRFRIKPRTGPPVVFQSEEWPVDELGKAWEARAVPAIVRRMTGPLESGEGLEFRASSLLALRIGLLGLLLVAGAAGLLYRWLRMDPGEGRGYSLASPVFLVTTGGVMILNALRARGGIIVYRDGVRRRRSDATIPWGRVRLLTAKSGGLVLDLDDGTTITMGSLTRNYPVCLELLRSGMAAAR